MFQEFVLQLKFYNKNFNKYKPLPRSVKPSLLYILKNPSLQLLPSFSLTPIQSLIYPENPITLVHCKRNASFPLLFEFDFLCLWFFFLSPNKPPFTAPTQILNLISVFVSHSSMKVDFPLRLCFLELFL